MNTLPEDSPHYKIDRLVPWVVSTHVVLVTVLILGHVFSWVVQAPIFGQKVMEPNFAWVLLPFAIPFILRIEGWQKIWGTATLLLCVFFCILWHKLVNGGTELGALLFVTLALLLHVVVLMFCWFEKELTTERLALSLAGILVGFFFGYALTWPIHQAWAEMIVASSSTPAITAVIDDETSPSTIERYRLTTGLWSGLTVGLLVWHWRQSCFSLSRRLNLFLGAVICGLFYLTFLKPGMMWRKELSTIVASGDQTLVKNGFGRSDVEYIVKGTLPAAKVENLAFGVFLSISIASVLRRLSAARG